MTKTSAVKTPAAKRAAAPAKTRQAGATNGSRAPKSNAGPAATKAGAAKPAAKAAPKPVVKSAARPAAKAAPKTAKPAAVKPAAKTAAKTATANQASAANAVTAAKPAGSPKEKLKKPKLVRDSFTMPETEYQVLGEVKKACLKAGVDVKKSELLRAGVALLRDLDPARLKQVLGALPPLKPGRPKKEK